jgi:hypothetical protein
LHFSIILDFRYPLRPIIVAHAPRNVHRRIPTLDELSSDSKHSIISTSEVFHFHLFSQKVTALLKDNLKLQILTSTLVPASMLQEPDIPWTFENLLRVRYFSSYFRSVTVLLKEITNELSDFPNPLVPAPVLKKNDNGTATKKSVVAR